MCFIFLVSEKPRKSYEDYEISKYLLNTHIHFLQDEPLMNGGCDGSFGSRKLFNCPPNQGLFAQLNDVIKYDDFLFANPGKNSHLL